MTSAISPSIKPIQPLTLDDHLLIAAEVLANIQSHKIISPNNCKQWLKRTIKTIKEKIQWAAEQQSKLDKNRAANRNWVMKGTERPSWITTTTQSLSDPKEKFYRAQADGAIVTGLGCCGEMTSIGYFILKENYHLTSFHKIALERRDSHNEVIADHSYLLIGTKYESSVILDPWSGKYFPETEKKTKLKNCLCDFTYADGSPCTIALSKEDSEKICLSSNGGQMELSKPQNA